MELTDGSISTRSFSFRDMVKGLRRTSLEVLVCVNKKELQTKQKKHTLIPPLAYCVALRPDNARNRLVFTEMPMIKVESDLRGEVLQSECSSEG